MASSSVQYYEKQKELQDTMANCEQKRMDLERQLRMSLQAGQTSSKMKAARLHSYWKKICEDEKRAKQRNEALMREFERIDAHMYEMSARTQRLAFMKKQYEDYISRTYPEWNELMYGKPPQTQLSHETHGHDSHTPQDAAPMTPEKQINHQQAHSHSQATPVSHHPVTATTSSSSTHSAHSTRQQSGPPQPDLPHQVISDEVKKSDSYFSYQESGIYQNLPSVRSESEQRLHQEDDTPSSARIDGISQPIQSVEIQSKKSGQTIQSSKYSMEPAPHEEDEDQNSDFGTDNEMPMAKSSQNTMVRKDLGEQAQDTLIKSHGTIKPELTIDGLLNLLRLVEFDIPDAFSPEGYYRSSWPETSVKNDIIRKANSNGDLGRIDVNLISMVILEQITLIIRSLAEQCLIPESFLQGDLSNLSPHKLSQHLSPEAQIVWNALFEHFVKLVRSQVMKSFELSAIFTPCMVSDNASQDKAHTFVVHLLESLEGNNDDKMVLQGTGKSMSPAGTMEGSGSFMDDGRVPPLKFGSLLERPLSDDDSSFIHSLPRDSVPLNETAAYRSMISTGGSDPPRRQSSAQEDTDDDVEKQIATAISTKPAVMRQSPRKKMDVDEPSETSSQTLQTTSHVYVPTALETKSPRHPAISPQKKFQGVRISSDLDTDTEVDAGIFGSSRRAEDNYDFDFYD